MSRQNKFLLLINITVGLIGVGLVLFFVFGRDDGTSADQPGRSVSVESGEAATLRYGGTTVRLPQGAVDESATLSIAPSQLPPPADSSFVGNPVSIDLDQPLRSDATVVMPVPGGLGPRMIPAYFDEETDEWMIVDAFRPSRKQFEIRTSHFTGFSIIKFAGFRADKPKCQSPAASDSVEYLLPDDAVQFGEGNRMLFACANRTSGAGSFELRVVNNRGYLMPVEFPRGLRPEVQISNDLTDAALQTLVDLGRSLFRSNTVLVPPGGRVEVQVQAGTAPFLVSPKPSDGAAMVGIGVDVAGEIDKGFGRSYDLAKCLYGSGSPFLGGLFSGIEYSKVFQNCFEGVLSGTGKLKVIRTVLKRVLLAEVVVNIAEARGDASFGQFSRVGVKPARLRVESWRLSPTGIGPLRLGMTEAEARIVVPGLRVKTGPFCDSWSVPGLQDVSLLAPPDGLHAVNPLNGSAHSPAGVTRGMSEAELKSRIGTGLEEVPGDKYTPDNYRFYRVYSSDRKTTMQFTIDTSTGEVSFIETGYPGEFYYPDGNELCA